MSDPPVDPAILDENQCVAVDLPCQHCGYNLRTLALRGRCPECGTAVAESARDTRLCRADPRWVTTLADSALLLLTALSVGMFWLWLLGMLVLAFQQPGLDTACVMGPILLCALVAAAALIGLTAPEPRQARSARGPWARRIVRSLLVATVVLTVGPAIALDRTPTLAAWGWAAAGVIAVALVPGATLRHLGDLMRRVPRPDLARRCRICLWLLLGALLSYLIPVALIPINPRFPRLLFPLCGLPSVLALFALVALGFVTLLSIRHALAKAAHEASEYARERASGRRQGREAGCGRA